MVHNNNMIKELKPIQLNSKLSFKVNLRAGDVIDFNQDTLDLILTRLKTLKVKHDGAYKITIERVSK